MSEPLSYADWKAQKSEPMAYAEWKASQKELPAGNRFLSGVGGEVLKAGSGLADVLPENAAHQWLKEKSKQGLDKATGAAGEVGKFVGASAPYFALPGGGILKTALMSGGLAGATTEGDIGERALSAGTTTALTAAGGALIPAGKKAYEVVSPIFTPQRNAVNKIIAELSGEGVGKLQVPNRLNAVPDEFIGPGTPVLFKNTGAEPTTAMLAHLDKSMPEAERTALLKLEMNARLRNPEGFFNRDNANAAASYKTLESMAMPEQVANTAQDAVNAATWPMREQAFDAALENPTYRKQMADYIAQKADEPGVRFSSAVPLINRARDSLILRPAVPAQVEIGTAGAIERAPSKPWHSSGIDTEKDSLLTAITKLGGINKDMAQGTYGNKIWEDVPNGFNVFRNKGGESLDDLSARLTEHGYLPEGSGPNDLVDALYGNPRELFSNEKIDFGYAPEQGADDFLRERLDSLIGALSRKNAPKQKLPQGELESTAHPADLYALKKELVDKLALKTVSPDELTNAAKGNRRTAYEIMQNVDDSLNDASGGKWDAYNKEYAAKIAPVTEGRAFQDILNKFELSKPIYGTETPQLTARALRKAVADETYMNQGKKGYVSTISEGARAKTDDVIKTINAIEQAKAGPRGTSGSQTADNIASLAKSAISAGGGMTSKALQIVHALGVTRGARKLDDAMLNPDKLQPLIDAYNKRMAAGNIPDTRISEMIRQLTQRSIAGAQNE